MKHFDLLAFLLLVVTLASGCTSSVYPVVGKPSGDLKLTGTWQKVDSSAPGPAEVTLHKVKADGAYLGKFYDKEFLVNVSKIGERYYYNAKWDPIDEMEDFGVKLSTKLNLFGRVELQEDVVQIYPVNDPQAHTFLTKHNLAFLDDRGQFLIVTETTEKLCQVIEEHGDKLFSEKPISYRRQVEK